MDKKVAMVVGAATGKQGGAVVVHASLEDTAALKNALEGATSPFAMTTPYRQTGVPHFDIRVH